MTVREQLAAYCRQNEGDPTTRAIVATFTWSLPSMSAYTKDETFHQWRRLVEYVCLRNLSLQFGLSRQTAKPKWADFVELLRSFPPSFLDKNNYDNDLELLRNTVIGYGDSLFSRAMSKLSDPASLSKSERQAIEFALAYLPLKSEEAASMLGFGSAIMLTPMSLYAGLTKGLLLTGEVWTQDFNRVYNQTLGYQSVPMQKSKGRLALNTPMTKEDLRVWKLGDILVGLGLAYWCAYVSSSGKTTSLLLYLPGNVFEHMKSRSYLYDLSGEVREKVAIVSHTTPDQHRWSQDNVGDDKASEGDIELALLPHPELIEASLQWYDPNHPNQFRTTVGIIDLLGRSADGTIVVIELKRDRAAPEVIGQIQKYLVWAEENIALGHRVRGIVIAQSFDSALEAAAKGSRFSIDVKVFDDIPSLDLLMP